MTCAKERRIRRGIDAATVVGLIVVAVAPATVGAQQPGSGGEVALKREPRARAVNKRDGGSMEALLMTIKRLETRVEELESRLEKVDDRARQNEGVAAKAKDVLSDLQKQEEESRPLVSFFKRTKVSGSIDSYYGFNFNRPAESTIDELTGTGNQLFPFARFHNQFSFNLAKLTVEQAPDLRSPLGFKLDLAFGPATEVVHAAEPGGRDIFRHIEQAYLSYVAPVGSGLRLDFGKFVTPVGAEVIESQDNWNYSRGLLFSWAIPFYHVGARATYQFDRLAVSGFLLNGWNNVVDNNSGKTVGVQVAWQPTTKFRLVQNYMTGPENDNDKDNDRHLLDTVLTYDAGDNLSLMLNADYATDRLTDGPRVFWTGVAAYARYAFTDRFALSPRFEWFHDHNGFATGVAQQLKEFTLTSEFRPHKNFITKLEYRVDWSDEKFFKNGSGRLKSWQQTALLGFVIRFSSNDDR